MNVCFDLIDSQKKARGTLRPKALFELWEWVSSLYDRREINPNEFEELRAVVWDQFHHLEALRRVRLSRPARSL